MSIKIYGSKPRTFPVGSQQTFFTLIKVYGDLYEGGTTCSVPEGQVLIIPEHGGWESPVTTRHEFPAGTRFRVLRAGDPFTLSVTEVLP